MNANLRTPLESQSARYIIDTPHRADEGRSQYPAALATTGTAILDAARARERKKSEEVEKRGGPQLLRLLICVFTDLPPRGVKALREFKRSDSLDRLAIVPDGSELQTRAALFERALAEEDQRRVRVEGNSILSLLAQTYTVSRPKLRVLGARPVRHWEGVQSELFGDYDFEAKRIRIWMRTAVLAKVTSYRGLLNTLLHEFCHHLDREGLGFSSSPHTRGFYTRIDQLYHLALATPPEQRKPLAWIRIGDAWRIDWMRMRTRSREQPYAVRAELSRAR